MNSLVLHQIPPLFGLPSFSPFCLKVQIALGLKQLPFTVANTWFAKRVNPRGKLPFLVWGEQRLEDSTAIIEALDAHPGGARLLPEAQGPRFEAHLLEDWADESLYWHAVYAKYADDDGWARIRPAMRLAFPRILRPVAPIIARRGALSKLAANGLTRRGKELISRQFDRHLDALDSRLEGKRWLVGNEISIADVAVTAMLGQLVPVMVPAFAARVAQRSRLSALIEATLSAAGMTSLKASESTPPTTS